MACCLTATSHYLNQWWPSLLGVTRPQWVKTIGRLLYQRDALYCGLIWERKLRWVGEVTAFASVVDCLLENGGNLGIVVTVTAWKGLKNGEFLLLCWWKHSIKVGFFGIRVLHFELNEMWNSTCWLPYYHRWSYWKLSVWLPSASVLMIRHLRIDHLGLGFETLK